MQFSELPLNSNILKGVEALGFTSPTPVQEKSIPLLIVLLTFPLCSYLHLPFPIHVDIDTPDNLNMPLV